MLESGGWGRWGTIYSTPRCFPSLVSVVLFLSTFHLLRLFRVVRRCVQLSQNDQQVNFPFILSKLLEVHSFVFSLILVIPSVPIYEEHTSIRRL